MEKYHGDAFGHWITVLFESIKLYEMGLIGVPALVNVLPVNAMESGICKVNTLILLTWCPLHNNNCYESATLCIPLLQKTYISV